MRTRKVLTAGWFRTTALVASMVLSGLAASGCNAPGKAPQFTEQDSFGRAYYIDGAGNWGYGVKEVPAGLRKAGYRGRVVNFAWSPFRNPALDQTIGRSAARAKGRQLAEEIGEYLSVFPGRSVDIIALSAGTGVAVWACENLAPPVRVRNLVLLGSSLSAAYNMSKALANIDGAIYVYYSDRDAVLNCLVPWVGTIDGRQGGQCAGQAGLHPQSGDNARIRNIPWSAQHAQDGWDGSHTGGTSESFVARFIAAHLVETPTALHANAAPTRKSGRNKG